MPTGLSTWLKYSRLGANRLLSRLGLRDETAMLLMMSVVIGLITGVAAVIFHELIVVIRNSLYDRIPTSLLYGPWMVLLIVFPAAGGLAVGIIGRYIFRTPEGHGIADIIESVYRSSGFVKPRKALEKIFTAAVTIGTGGSAGAEAPIVQIGAGIASGVGRLFNVARQHMPILAGCGCAAGISAIFNAPIGGVLFALEIIMYDFSVRTFSPVVVASVLANTTTSWTFVQLGHPFGAIFATHVFTVTGALLLDWSQVGNFILLGLICGLIGVAMTRLMYATTNQFARIKRMGVWRPAIGGALLGVLGVGYILAFGHGLKVSVPNFASQPSKISPAQAAGTTPVTPTADQSPAPPAKPVATAQFKPFSSYSMPAFYGDGDDVVRQLLSHDFYGRWPGKRILLLLGVLCAVKVVGTCLTLGSGGSGGVISPSLFLGAVAGSILGILLQRTGWFPHIQPELYALAGMGAVLAAVIHAPLASILICFEMTEDYKVMVPTMLAVVFATGFARLLFEDSIYTLTLRQHGVRVGGPAGQSLLRRLSVEQVQLEPATVVHPEDPLQAVLDQMIESGVSDFAVIDHQNVYRGMVLGDDLKTALLSREAIPLLVVGEMMRPEIPSIDIRDDLLSVLDVFNRYEVSRLPVSINGSNHIVGLISRSALMRRQQQAMGDER
jgi:CIC family chloride channel protein